MCWEFHGPSLEHLECSHKVFLQQVLMDHSCVENGIGTQLLKNNVARVLFDAP